MMSIGHEGLPYFLKHQTQEEGKLMSLDAITFDTDGFELQGDIDRVRVWLTPWRDRLELHQSSLLPPDLSPDWNDSDSVREVHRTFARESGLGVIEIEKIAVDGCAAVRSLFKAAQQPTGRKYLGFLEMPFQDCHYVFRVACHETGPTGIRDTSILMKLLGSGHVVFDEETRSTGGWLDDPYDPHERGDMTRNRSERPEYDSLFPNHPLTRARWVLDHLQHTVLVSEPLRTKSNAGEKVDDDTDESSPLKDMQILGGPGGTFETAISIKGVYDNAIGVKVEYFVLEKMFGQFGYDWVLQRQELHHRGDFSYDLMHLRLQDGSEVVVYFEITDCFKLINDAIRKVISERPNDDLKARPE
jgi:hypothetical protein